MTVTLALGEREPFLEILQLVSQPAQPKLAAFQLEKDLDLRQQRVMKSYPAMASVCAFTNVQSVHLNTAYTTDRHTQTHTYTDTHRNIF